VHVLLSNYYNVWVDSKCVMNVQHMPEVFKSKWHIK